jgi:hypothetical protein
MAAGLISWWQRILALLHLDQQSRDERWVEPGNEVTRAILAGKVPALPDLAPAPVAAYEYERFEEAPALEAAAAIIDPTTEPAREEEAIAVVAAPGRAGRAA